jgi:uncharacterized protein (DUF362 family)
VASKNRPGIRLHRVHAEGENAPLDRRHAQHENMFGIVPGSRYGWPKNVLHWAGIHESILDICATVRPHFVIADGIIAMEGDGPLNGTPKALHTILFADDPAAADAELTRLLGLNTDRVQYIQEAGGFIGNIRPSAISKLS